MLTRSYLPTEKRKSLLAYTPMLHARLFASSRKHRNESFQPMRTWLEAPLDAEGISKIDASNVHLDGNMSLDRSLIVQFCANDPDQLLAAARYVEPFCDAVDLNLGCPQGIARKGRYGAFLQEHWDLIHRLISQLHRELSIPVTAKIRILDTKELTLAYAQMVVSAGASILTVHGRRRDQMGQNTGLADWNYIRYLRENLPQDVVLFANGNVLQHEDLELCRTYTGADAVMAAEAALYDPTVFSPRPAVKETNEEYWVGRDGKGGYRMDAVVRRYLDIIYRHVLEAEPPQRRPLFVPSDARDPTSGPPTGCDYDDGRAPEKSKRRSDKMQSPSLRYMQSHLFHLLRPLIVKHVHVRQAVAQCCVGEMSGFEKVLALVENVSARGMIEYEQEQQDSTATTTTTTTTTSTTGASGPDAVPRHISWDVDVDFTSSQGAIERCKRPWWVCQPYIRSSPQEAVQKGSLVLKKTQEEER